MSYLERVIADSADREGWMAVRPSGIGASDAASFSKPESVELYVRAKLRESGFRGNVYTETGNRWERAAVAAAGYEQNTLMFRSVYNPFFFATPDGLRVLGGTLVLAEAKAVLVKDDEWPTWHPKVPPRHQRQMWWAQYVLDAAWSEYIVLPYDEHHTPRTMTPTVIPFPRDAAAIDRLLSIAHPVLAAMQAAAVFERSLVA